MAGLIDPTMPNATTVRPMMSGGAPAAAQVPAVPMPPTPAAPPVQSAAQPMTWQALFGPQAVAQAQANPDPLGRAGALVAGGLSQLDRISPRDPSQVVADIYHGVQGLYGAAGRFAQGFTGSAAQAAQPAQPAIPGAGLVTPAAAAQPVAVASSLAAAAPSKPVASGVLAGRGLYAYDTGTGPTAQQAIAIQQAMGSGMGSGMPSPAAMHQPAMNLQSMPTIPLSVAPAVQEAAAGKNAITSQLYGLVQQQHNDALEGIKNLPDAQQGAKVKDEQDAMIARLYNILNPPNLQMQSNFGPTVSAK